MEIERYAPARKLTCAGRRFAMSFAGETTLAATLWLRMESESTPAAATETPGGQTSRSVTKFQRSFAFVSVFELLKL